MPFDSHIKKKHPGKLKKNWPLNAYMVGSDDEAFLPFWGRFGLFSRGPASGLWSFHFFPGPVFWGGAQSLRVDNTQRIK